MNLVADGVRCRAGNAVLLDGVDLELEPGRVHALLGPNGAGKTTLLRVLAGDRRPDAGDVRLGVRPLRDWPPGDLARQRAVLPQHHALAFGFLVEEVVALGCLPHPPRSAPALAKVVLAALTDCGVSHLQGRRYPTLSGGERARVQLARVLLQLRGGAERPGRWLLLDEPTANLDLAHQQDCLTLARRLASTGTGVLVVLHDPNLALRHADRVLLLQRGRVLADGPPALALSAANLEALYSVPVRRSRQGELLVAGP